MFIHKGLRDYTLSSKEFSFVHIRSLVYARPAWYAVRVVGWIRTTRQGGRGGDFDFGPRALHVTTNKVRRKNSSYK